MNKQEIAEILAKPYSQDLLSGKIPARFAYIGLDGDPRVIPVGFHWDGETLQIFTVPKSAKVKALQQNPRVSITIDTEGYPPKVLLLRGSAKVDLLDGVPDEYVEASGKIVPDDQFEQWQEGVRALYTQMVRISITFDWVKLLDFETTIPKAVEDIIREKQGS
ncbi:MAG TPA: pyridoxamine 5'-phosphate oxidase family protein [Kribbella sp.]|uniref:pyridoxamine 5'-phosphate oxidase family protein n=1 Tax=Kribbella sp. TaxID=1871183 RepID=UPI002D77473D|nr:pyridoxamine 5'-phosphate oxidase family protein [Kribbella sp.]HET6296476.1 pyridoxamine 5'-phosphate oxidase family protein [Kribbella sp.]